MKRTALSAILGSSLALGLGGVLAACSGGENGAREATNGTETVDDGGGSDGDAIATDAGRDDASQPNDAAPSTCPAPPFDTTDPAVKDCVEPVGLAFGSSIRRTVTSDGSSWHDDTHDVKDAGAEAGSGAWYSAADHYKNYAAAVGLGVIVVVGNGGALRSTDGKTWAVIPSVTGSLHTARIMFTEDRFVIVSLGAVFVSTDGTTFTKTVAPWSIGHLQSAASAHGTLMVIGEGGTMRRSKDKGTTWLESKLASAGGVAPTDFAIGSNGTRFVALAKTPAGYRAYSDDDGATWTVASGGNAADGTAITFDGEILWNGQEFVSLPGFSGSGTFVSATGAGPWTKLPIGPRVSAATRLGDGFIGVGGAAFTKIYRSTDGKTWNGPVFPGTPDPASAYPSPNVLSYYGVTAGLIRRP